MGDVRWFILLQCGSRTNTYLYGGQMVHFIKKSIQSPSGQGTEKSKPTHILQYCDISNVARSSRQVDH